MAKKVLILGGDGAGPEVCAQAEKVLCKVAPDVIIDRALIGGAAIDEYGEALPKDTLAAAKRADAVLLGAVGAPKYDSLAAHKRPERGLLQLRAAMKVYANLRPAHCYPQLAAASSLRENLVRGLDVLIVRELTGGIYFGEPRGISEGEGGRRAFNTMVYSEAEIARVARAAFDAARRRGGRVCSVDKANVLEVSILWREVVSQVAGEYPDVALSHLYVDNAAMQLVINPAQFDVLLTGNLFGDILSDIAAALTGSIGMLPSASLGEGGLFEPVHGSAPDIAGRDIVNPLAAILSVAMMLRYRLDNAAAAEVVENAVRRTIADGARSKDLGGNMRCSEMGAAVLANLSSAAN
ncbi:MAG: 3-isopropylmalate dehydrogenase [Gammaproteobacteria bacterium]